MIDTASRIARLPRSPRRRAFVLAHLALLLPLGVSADTYGDYTYTVSGGEATITGYGGPGGTVSIPSTIGLGNYPVTAIGNEAFYECTSLTAVTIPNSVTAIGKSAFSRCSSLTSIIIPDNVTSIGVWGFALCTSLASVDIGTSVGDIGNEAFYECTSLTAVTIPSSVTNIGYNAFYKCTSLTAITVSGSNPEYTGLDGILFNKNCTTLLRCPCRFSGSYAIPASVTSIGDYAFDQCASLTGATISGGVTNIGKSAFSRCTSLTSIIIPSSVTTIGNSAFHDCALTTVTIPYSVTTIGNGAFGACASLTTITVSENNPNYADIDGVLFNKNRTALIQYPRGLSDSSYTVPDSVTDIGKYAFLYCESLTAVTIPNSVTNISTDAFFCCTSLTSLVIGNSIANISTTAFYWCSSLTRVLFTGNAPKVVGVSAFFGASGTLRHYRFPDATGWNQYLDGFPVELLPLTYTSDGTQVTITGLDSSYRGHHLFLPATSNGCPVTAIGDWAFYNCANLTAITVPNSISNIGECAFFNCTNLTDVTIPDSVTNIGYGTFYRCASLTSVTIPDSVTAIGGSVFAYCSSLTDVTIPDSVTVIDEDVFSFCTSLTDVTIPGSVTSISDYAFRNCTSLTSVIIPGSVTHIGEGAFYQCSALTSVLFTGDAPTTVSVSAFLESPVSIIYYLPGTKGWGSHLVGYRAVCWNPVFNSASLAADTFVVTLTGNATAVLPVYLEASDSLTSPDWSILDRITIPADDTVTFTDYDAGIFPSRFYRITFPR